MMSFLFVYDSINTFSSSESKLGFLLAILLVITDCLLLVYCLNAKHLIKTAAICQKMIISYDFSYDFTVDLRFVLK